MRTAKRSHIISLNVVGDNGAAPHTYIIECKKATHTYLMKGGKDSARYHSKNVIHK